MMKGFYDKKTGDFYIKNNNHYVDPHPVRSGIKGFLKSLAIAGIILLILIILF